MHNASYNFRPTPIELERSEVPVHLLLSATLRKSATFAIYDALLREYGAKDRFLPFECERHEIERREHLIASFRLNGSSIGTIMVSDPFKFAAADWCDNLTDSASETGAVNLIVKSEQGLTGNNLDGKAFAVGLASEGETIAGKSMLFLGCGGVATAVALESAMTLARVGLYDPDRARMMTLRDRLFAKFPSVPVSLVDDRSDRDLRGYDVVYNATGLGKTPREGATPLLNDDRLDATLYVDAVYRPSLTQFLCYGKRVGARVVNGASHMLASSALHCSAIMGRTVGVEEARRTARRLGFL